MLAAKSGLLCLCLLMTFALPEALTIVVDADNGTDFDGCNDLTPCKTIAYALRQVQEHRYNPVDVQLAVSSPHLLPEAFWCELINQTVSLSPFDPAGSGANAVLDFAGDFLGFETNTAEEIVNSVTVEKIDFVNCGGKNCLSVRSYLHGDPSKTIWALKVLGCVFAHSPTGAVSVDQQWNNGGSVHIEDCRFDGMTTGSTYFGVLDFRYSETVTIQGSSVTNCASPMAPLIYAYHTSGDLILNSTLVEGNVGEVIQSGNGPKPATFHLIGGSQIINNAAAFGSPQVYACVYTDGKIVRDDDSTIAGNTHDMNFLCDVSSDPECVPCMSCGGAGSCALTREYLIGAVPEGSEGLSSGCTLCRHEFGRTTLASGKCVCKDSYPECGSKCELGVYYVAGGGNATCERDIWIDGETGSDANFPCLHEASPCATIQSVSESGFLGMVGPRVHIGPGQYAIPEQLRLGLAQFEFIGAGSSETHLVLGNGTHHEHVSTNVLVPATYTNTVPGVINITGLSLSGGTAAADTGGGGCLQVGPKTDRPSNTVVYLEDISMEGCFSFDHGGGLHWFHRGPGGLQDVSVFSSESMKAGGGALVAGSVHDGQKTPIRGGGVWNNLSHEQEGGIWMFNADIGGGFTIDGNVALKGFKGGVSVSYDRLGPGTVVKNNHISEPPFIIAKGGANVACTIEDASDCIPCGECNSSERQPYARCAIYGDPLADVAGTNGCIECDAAFGQVWDEAAQVCVCQDGMDCTKCKSGGGIFNAATGDCAKTVLVDAAEGDDEGNWPCLSAPCKTLGAAWNVALDGSGLEISLAAGQYYAPDVDTWGWGIFDDVSVRGPSRGAGEAWIDLGGKGIFMGSRISVWMQRVTLHNGGGTGGQDWKEGGCIFVDGYNLRAHETQLYLMECVVRDCASSHDGGCIAVETNNYDHTKVTIERSLLTNCTAGGDGGGIKVSSKTSLGLVNSVIEHCSAGGKGGGIATDSGGLVTLTSNSEIRHNSAGRGLGNGVSLGRYARFTTTDIGANIHSNGRHNIDCDNPDAGQCLPCGSCDEDVGRCTLPGFTTAEVRGPSGCSACEPARGQRLTDDGDCVCADEHPHCLKCAYNGGGVYDAATQSCVFSLAVGGAGGYGLEEAVNAMYVSPEPWDEAWQVVIEGVVRKNSTGDFHVRGALEITGGGVLDLGGNGRVKVWRDGELTLSDVTVQNGVAGLDGGCVYVDSRGLLEAERVVLRECRAGDDGGCLYVAGDGAASFAQSVLTGCEAADDGGAAAVGGGGILSLFDGGVVGNSAAGSGQGIYVAGSGMVSLGGGFCMSGNSDGGGLVCDGVLNTVCRILTDDRSQMTLDGGSGPAVECLMNGGRDEEGQQRSCAGLEAVVPLCIGETVEGGCGPRLRWDEEGGSCRWHSPLTPGSGAGYGWVLALVAVMALLGAARWKVEDAAERYNHGMSIGMSEVDLGGGGGGQDASNAGKFGKLVEEEEGG